MTNRSRLLFSRLATLLLAGTSLCFGSGTAQAQLNWTRVESTTTNTLIAIDFPTGQIGYAVGDGGTILKSTDGGATWAQLSSPTNVNLWTVRFRSATEGFVAGDEGNVFKTTDGGITWTSSETGIRNQTGFSFMFGLQLFDANTVFVAGGDGNVGSGVVIKSTDNGATWSQIYIPGTLFLDKVYFKSPDMAYVVGASLEGGTVSQTTDGGVTWMKMLEAPNLITAMHFFDDQRAMAVGRGGLRYRTTDAGMNWDDAEPIGTDLLDILFEGNVGIIIGDVGTTLLSTDGGLTWVTQTIDAGLLMDVHYSPANGSAFIVGTEGALFRASLAVAGTPDAPVTGEPRVSVTPNPMRGDGLLRIEDAVDGAARRVTVHDLLGRVVLERTVENGGTLPLDGSALPAGRYIYTVHAADGTPTRGMFIVE